MNKEKNNFIIKKIISSSKIIITDKYGDLLTTAGRLRNGITPSIATAINKNQYFINKANYIHNNKYEYSKSIYNGIHTKICITCKIHGDFYQEPNAHFRGQGCLKCGNSRDKNRKNTVDFINKATSIHDNKYTYDFVNYTKSNEFVEITCRIHGNFKQQASVHLRGFGCKECSRLERTNNSWHYSAWNNKGNESKNFKNYTLYIIKCTDDLEQFYKIGKTFNSLKTRFSSKIKMPYNYEIVKLITADSLTISKLEQNIKTLNKDFKYLPNKKFGGRFECFSKIKLEDEFYNL